MIAPSDTARASAYRMPLALTTTVLAANVVVLLGKPVPWLSPVAGCVLLFGLPMFLLYSKLDWQWADPSERLGYSLVLTLLMLMCMGLAINIVLPHVGVSRPLDRLPVLLAADAVLLALALWRRHHWPRATARRLPWLSGKDKTVLAFCVGILLASIAGAIRLNNDAGGGVTLAMLVAAAMMLALLLAWRRSLDARVVTWAVYCLAAALLLMTSLRGWYITGHDIQLEYRVFQLTKANGSWRMSRFNDPYNACLSITILPTMVAQLTRIADPYVYKLIFQLIFAYCSVMVYKLARRYASMGVALLAVIYFIAFPTFINDVPFIDRQEIAFLFVAGAFLMMTNGSAPLTTRRSFVALCSVGVVISHYSTAYVLIGTLLAAWLLRRATPFLLPAVNIARRWRHLPGLIVRPVRATSAIGLLNILVLVVASLLWTGAYTRTERGLTQTLSSVVQSIRGSPAPGSRSADVSYSLFSFRTPSEGEVWRDYMSAMLRETQAGRAAGVYYPKQLLSQYPTPMVTQKAMPVTRVGRDLGKVHVHAAYVNSVIRQGAARLYQVLLGVGLFAVLFSKRRGLARGVDFYALAWGATVVVAVQVVLPIVSIDYGILRAFQQALIVMSPFVAFGTIALFKWLGDRWSLALSSAVAILLFLSLSGVLPQVLGGYPPQLNLNNAGEYYDLYYPHPQEVAAIRWLGGLVSGKPGQTQLEIQTDRYTFNRVQTYAGVSPESDIWPGLLRKNAYVFLGTQTVQKAQAAISYKGDLILYEYPISLLDREKDLIFVDGGARIYR